MKKINTGLKEGILIDVTILLLFALLLLGFALLKTTEHILINQYSKTARTNISSIQNSITYIYQSRPELSFTEMIKSPVFQRLLMAYTGGDQFDKIMIVNQNLDIIYSSDDISSIENLEYKDFRSSIWKGNVEVKIRKQGLQFWFIDEGSRLEIYAPLYFGNQIKAGIIGENTLFALKLEQTKMRGLAFIFIAIDAVVFFIFGWFLLGRGIVKPVKKLLIATEEVSKGIFSYHIEMSEYHEINTLAKSFNRMTERLKEKTEHLNKTIEELKQSNLKLQTAQESLILAEKLATTGRLAAGLAHEIGNPLGSITTYLDYLLKDKNLRAENKDCLIRVQKEVCRIDLIVREFLDLASPSRGIITLVDMKKTISNILSLLKHRKEFKNIKIESNIPEYFPEVKLDAHKIQQVLFNILLNAADAVNENEDIKVTGKVLGHEKKILISILDNGIGIEEKDIQKIFDPFFTTKEPGKGTGLGLSICQKIITDMGGEIMIESRPGRGTDVKIFLPLEK